jgi:hypothetical protein
MSSNPLMKVIISLPGRPLVQPTMNVDSRQVSRHSSTPNFPRIYHSFDRAYSTVWNSETYDQFTTLSYFLPILKFDPVQITNFFSGSMLEFDFLSTILTFQLSSPLPRTQICEGFVLTVLGKAAGSGTVHLFQTTGKDIPIHSFAIVHAAAAEETVTLIDLSFKALAVLPKTVYSTAFVAGGIVKIEHALPSLPHAAPVLAWSPDRPPYISRKQHSATRYSTSDRKRSFIHPSSHTLEENLLRTPCSNLQRTQIFTIQRAHRAGYSKANCGFPRFPE